MNMQSKGMINNETKNQITRAVTIKPRLDYAVMLTDKILGVLTETRLDLIKNQNLAQQKKDGVFVKSASVNEPSYTFEIFFTIEALRQVRRRIDSIFGLGNVTHVLGPTISIVRTVRSHLFCLFPYIDMELGELSIILGGLIIDAGHLVGACINFEKENQMATMLMDEAKLIADSKFSKQFPNLDFS